MPTKEEGIGRSDLLKIMPEAFGSIALGANLRQELEGITELAADIAEKGQLQPGVVRRNGQKQLELVCGFRRFAAIQKIAEDAAAYGLPAPLPFLARLVVLTDEQALVANLGENMQRENLSPMDLAYAAQRLTVLDWSQETIGKTMKMQPAAVSRLLSLLSLPKNARLALHRGEIRESAAHALLGKSESQVEQTLDRLKAGEVKAADLATEAAREKRAAGKKRARSLKELRTQLEALGSDRALDLLSWLAGEIKEDSELGRILA